jgi:hypothetical protein
VCFEQTIQPLPDFGTAGAFTVQQCQAFGWVGNSDCSGKQVEFVHRIGPPIHQADLRAGKRSPNQQICTKKPFGCRQEARNRRFKPAAL